MEYIAETLLCKMIKTTRWSNIVFWVPSITAAYSDVHTICKYMKHIKALLNLPANFHNQEGFQKILMFRWKIQYEYDKKKYMIGIEKTNVCTYTFYSDYQLTSIDISSKCRKEKNLICQPQIN